MKRNIKIIFIYSVLLSLFAETLTAQTFSFRHYGAERNIPNPFTYTINQTDDGYLWVGMGNGIARFDGFEFFMSVFPDSATGRYSTSSFKDETGTLWYGCNDGSVFYVKNRKLIQVNIANSRSISKVIKGPDGKIFVIPQGTSIFSIDASNPAEVSQYNHDISSVIFSGCFTPNGELLLGTQENLIISRLEGDAIRILDVIEDFDYAAVTSIVNIPGSPSEYIIGADGSGIYLLTINNSSHVLKRIKGLKDSENLNIQSIFIDNDNNIWASTFGNGVIQFKLSQDRETAKDILTYDISTGLNSNDIKTVFQDLEGNYWFGSYGNGISMLNSYAVGSFVPGKTSRENNIIYVGSLKNKYMLGTPSGFHLFDPVAGKSESFTNLLKHTGNVDIMSYFKDTNGDLWFGTAGAGLYVMNAEGKVKLFYRSGDTGIDNIRSIKIDDRNIWLATINGLIVVNKFTGEFFRKFDISNGLEHSSINAVYLDRDGRIIIGNNEGGRLFYIDRNYDVRVAKGTMEGNLINRIQAISQGQDGTIWIATRGNEIFKFDNDTVTAVHKNGDFLSSYCYGILADKDKNIWVGHEVGFSRYNSVTGTIKTFGTGFAKGGMCNRAMIETDDDKILIGTTEGLIIYDKKKDNIGQRPPLTNLNYITINDKRYDYQPVYTLPFRDYIIRPNFVGIYFNDPDKVNYSVFVENFNDTWSNLSSERGLTYTLRDGKYKFNVISVNDEGISQQEPLSFIIIIKKPWWRTGVAITAWILLIVGTVVLIINIREKAQKRRQEFLEAELEARTKVIKHQKEEIELQNIEITDSINYAKRIQTSILPDYNKLKEVFSDAFVIFRPRNIVSGDFYWFDWLDKDKFILVCADSTGHGVPGAFMSMIGTTLLRDIVTRQRISKPSHILSLLDKQIFSTLNQNIELGIASDGMDIVVCEFNLKQRHVRFASAMRPLIIIIDGEPFYIKGNRASISGESVMEKYFDDHEYYLNAGDTIYLFSDGLSDQFGGADGKKMKIARLKTLIEQISSMPMEEQKSIINNFYDSWKGNHEQVDDILLIGIKI